jgi:nucleotide sugar dehydrogenase
MDAATKEISKGLKPGTLVSYETTLPVGTTRNRLTPMLESGSGLQAGKDFFVVFSPERVLTGRVFGDLRRYPKLVGGIDELSEKRGIDFYSQVLDFDDRPDLSKQNGVWSLGSTEASEMAKLAETTYRDVNIALANQFALYSENNGIDFSAVREACNSQPFSHIHLPGIAVGGHCIPVYPRLYLWNDPEATIVRAARQANASMPEKIVIRIEKEIDSVFNNDKVEQTGLFDFVSAGNGYAPDYFAERYTDGQIVTYNFNKVLTDVVTVVDDISIEDDDTGDRYVEAGYIDSGYID